tara:strand:+ start:212 stop:817 length:606 start_codon:yes stop_codon:yes gene_type:complete
MTPYEHIEFELEQKKISQEKADNWHLPLFKTQNRTLLKCLDSMEDFKLCQEDVPLIIKLAENPKYDIGLFAGYVDLFSHDCIHILLGRGLLVKDEAFVIGYTMGSSRKMFRWRRNLFMFICKYLYPEGYKFGEEERYVFNSAVLLGSKCGVDLSKVKFETFLNRKLSMARRELKINIEDIEKFYSFEKQIFPNSRESQRLL